MNTRERHGKTDTPEYKIWGAIKDRTLNPRNAGYKNYGGRGIGICEEWRKSFKAFLRDVGSRPTPLHSIDRINNDLGYFKGNCRWATKREQSQNRRIPRGPRGLLGPRKNRKPGELLRPSIFLTHNGKTQSIAEWSCELGIHYQTLISRKKFGWSDERILTEPICKDCKRKPNN